MRLSTPPVIRADELRYVESSRTGKSVLPVQPLLVGFVVLPRLVTAFELSREAGPASLMRLASACLLSCNLAEPNACPYFRTLTATSLASSTSFGSLKSAVEGFNASVTRDRQDLLIDKHTNVKFLLRAAQKDLERRFSAKAPGNKSTQIWRKIKTGLERFCQVVYHYSSVMDVLVSAHPEIAALACE